MAGRSHLASGACCALNDWKHGNANFKAKCPLRWAGPIRSHAAQIMVGEQVLKVAVIVICYSLERLRSNDVYPRQTRSRGGFRLPRNDIISFPRSILRDQKTLISVCYF